MDFLTFAPLLTAFAVTAAVLYFLIPFLVRQKANQTERAEGVQSHLKKAGTPTMGGIGILCGLLAVFALFAGRYPLMIPVMILTLGFGIIGFLDDYLKVFLHRSDGLLPWQKLILEFLVTAGFLFYLVRVAHYSLSMLIPFTKASVDIGPAALPFAFIVILATVNGVNFTDGLDGLASGVTILTALFFAAAAAVMAVQILPFPLAVAGALMGFLLFNAYPAKIFMGDTGSLALGGFVSGMAYVLHMPLFIPVIGFIYAFELVSVVLQVSYFKITHGKRIFRMTPIHHHFELCGWSETTIVARFMILTAILCILAFAAL